VAQLDRVVKIATELGLDRQPRPVPTLIEALAAGSRVQEGEESSP
jgi:hypothetical protein